MKQRIKLMADYGCWALWEAGDDVGNISPDSLPLSHKTKTELQQWSAWYDSWLNQDDPALSGPSTNAEQTKFNAEGRRLWQALRSELPSHEVVYWESGKVHVP